MSIFVLLSPIPFFHFPFLKLSSINLKPLYSQYEEDNNYLPFQTTNKSLKKIISKLTLNEFLVG